MNERIQKLTDKVISALENGAGTNDIVTDPKKFTSALIDLKIIVLVDSLTKRLTAFETELEEQLPAIVAALNKLQR